MQGRTEETFSRVTPGHAAIASTLSAKEALSSRRHAAAVQGEYMAAFFHSRVAYFAVMALVALILVGVAVALHLTLNSSTETNRENLTGEDTAMLLYRIEALTPPTSKVASYVLGPATLDGSPPAYAGGLVNRGSAPQEMLVSLHDDVAPGRPGGRSYTSQTFEALGIGGPATQTETAVVLPAFTSPGVHHVSGQAIVLGQVVPGEFNAAAFTLSLYLSGTNGGEGPVLEGRHENFVLNDNTPYLKIEDLLYQKYTVSLEGTFEVPLEAKSGSMNPCLALRWENGGTGFIDPSPSSTFFNFTSLSRALTLPTRAR